MNSDGREGLADSDGYTAAEWVMLTLDVLDLILLFRVCLHLVDFVFALGSHISGVVTTVVDQLLLQGQVHHVGAHIVHEILRVPGHVKGVSL